MNKELSFKNIINLIFGYKTLINNRTYRLNHLASFIQHGINFIFIMGGFLYLGAQISIFANSFNIELSLITVGLLMFMFMFLLNLLIVKISPLVEIIEEEKK